MRINTQIKTKVLETWDKLVLKVAFFGYLAIYKTIKVQVFWLDHQHRYYGIISKGTISKSFCLFKPFIWNWIYLVSLEMIKWHTRYLKKAYPKIYSWNCYFCKIYYRNYTASCVQMFPCDYGVKIIELK